MKKKLGRGLQSLLGVDDDEVRTFHAGSDEVAADYRTGAEEGELRYLPLTAIDVNPYQPRREFDAEELAGLAESIRQHGVLQPVVVRAVESRFQLVAGERRFRAAHEAGLQSIPARLVDLDEQQTFEVALIENLQRKDLNPIEKAQAFQEYLSRFGATHEELAGHLAVDRSTVSNLVRLLELPESIQSACRSGQISFGHARCLLALEDPAAQIALCRRIISDELSVRQTEQAARDAKAAKSAAGQTDKAKPSISNHLRSLEEELKRVLGTKVEIRSQGKQRGTIVIHFQANDDFERVVSRITGRSTSD